MPVASKIYSAGKRAKQFFKSSAEKFKNLSPAKIAVIIVLIIIIYFVGKKIIVEIRKYIHRDIRKLDYDPKQLSYPKSDYYGFCSTLESAMQYTGTDEDSIYSVMSKIKNQHDWNFLQKAFGIRPKYGGAFDKDITGDLKMWLIDELGDVERQAIRDLMTKRNIKF